MAAVTRNIGLSLGADICWPIAFEEILAASELRLQLGEDTVEFACERLSLQPFTLARERRYDVVVDRLTHWFTLQREWIKKGVLMDDLYVYNNPWSVQSYEKHSSYCAMSALGMPIPRTVMLPQKRYDEADDLDYTLRRYASMFDLDAAGAAAGYPAFLKPYDGGGWRGVSKVDDAEGLQRAYDESGADLMHLQSAVRGFDVFVRAVGIGPQVRVMKYDPDQPLHERYRVDRDFVDDEARSVIEDTCLTINAFFGWDFNSVELLRRDGVLHPIDFANPCPDNQVNSIHYHWPWYVVSNLKWAVFNAATRRPMRKTLDFEPFYEIAREDLPYREKLSRYAAIARRRMSTDEFGAFCAAHLAPLEAAAVEWFRSPRCEEAVRLKVQNLFPEHEVEEFTARFLALVRRSVDDMQSSPSS
ncbi:MAG: ATP-grasp domain-containing protein [Planctomycetota bacterium]